MQIGDRVRVCNTNKHWACLSGSTGTISKILSPKDRYQGFIVVFDTPVLGFTSINLYEDEVEFL